METVLRTELTREKKSNTHRSKEDVTFFEMMSGHRKKKVSGCEKREKHCPENNAAKSVGQTTQKKTKHSPSGQR